MARSDCWHAPGGGRAGLGAAAWGFHQICVSKRWTVERRRETRCSREPLLRSGLWEGAVLVGVTALGRGGRPALGQGKDHWEVPSDGFASVSGQRLPGAERAARVMTAREFTSFPGAGHVLLFCPSHSGQALLSAARGHTPARPHGHSQLW